jgi:hypothetical protein
MPRHLKHRAGGHEEETRIRVTKATHERLKVLCDCSAATADTIVWQLLDFYELQRLELVIDSINKLYTKGLSLTQRSQLAILQSLLAEIDMKIGLNIEYL